MKTAGIAPLSPFVLQQQVHCAGNQASNLGARPSDTLKPLINIATCTDKVKQSCYNSVHFAKRCVCPTKGAAVLICLYHPNPVSTPCEPGSWSLVICEEFCKLGGHVCSENVPCSMYQ